MLDADEEVRVEQTEEKLRYRSGEHFWNWVTNSNPIARVLLGQLDLTPGQLAATKKAADDLIGERAAGTDTAVLISPINIGIGTK